MADTVIVGVVGGAACTPEEAILAEEVGRLVARRGALLICGGRGGVMEAACRGARSTGGTTIGILPGDDRDDANRWVSIPIATGLGLARNAIVARAADVLIAVAGGPGTLSEIALGLSMGKAVVSLSGWDLTKARTGPVRRGGSIPRSGLRTRGNGDLLPRFRVASSPEMAVKIALSLIRK